MADQQPDSPKLNEWQTEEKAVPTIVMGEDGEPQMGERVVKQRYMHVPLIPHTICSAGQHYFAFIDGGRRQDGRALVKCRRCPLGKQFLPHKHRLKDGRLIEYR